MKGKVITAYSGDLKQRQVTIEAGKEVFVFKNVVDRPGFYKIETLVFPIIAGYIPMANVRLAGEIERKTGNGWEKKTLGSAFVYLFVFVCLFVFFFNSWFFFSAMLLLVTKLTKVSRYTLVDPGFVVVVGFFLLSFPC